MNVFRSGLALDTMLAAIAAAARAPLAARPGAIADAMAPFLRDPLLLEGRDCPANPERYVRHLLGEGEGYAVVALVWRPMQMSPVHAHRTWCAFGVHRGILTEHHYEPATLRPNGAFLRCEGDTCHGPADPMLIHRLANCSAEVATSIHAYGAAFERMGEQVNLVLG
ncbi:cysteine dioxygenase [Roseococcus sp. DSY-14]|uniref:cysteine dioxygenase family protein n=1 Tax=Roseococcus sp. DSY-14 TaxID=3369650 RepID=UPI00387AE144